MNMKPSPLPKPLKSSKLPSGIPGFDEITRGGLPCGRTTLIIGGPGSGKTIFALQFLSYGARHCNEPGIFVAFEETALQILANAESFGWNLPQLQKKNLFFMDSKPAFDMMQSGDFDLCGMLAALDAKVREIGARRIVFDAMDVLLVLLPDAAAKRREIYRLHEWLLEHELTGIITLKSDGDVTSNSNMQPFDFMQFMVDCAVLVTHTVDRGVSQRSLRVQKYRGSSFDENESAFLIGKNGYEVAASHTLTRPEMTVSKERVSSGIKRLDTMLGGGYFRNASILITGFSGTAKTTMCGAFAEAACKRGEKTMFVCFDTNRTEILRNLQSVGVDIAPYVENGTLLLISARTIVGSAETYLVRIKTLAEEIGARCVVVDPMSAWSKPGNDLTTQTVADRLIDWSKINGITLLCTSLMDEMSGMAEAAEAKLSTPVQISALVDTWIHLSYLVQAGERNRGLSIVKSRGTAHSNQVRELILSAKGVTLADTYSAGGEVLMGTLRWEKERAELALKEASEADRKLKHVTLDAEEAELETRLKSIQVELNAKQVERSVLIRTVEREKEEKSQGRSKIRELRGADSRRRIRKEDTDE